MSKNEELKLIALVEIYIKCVLNIIFKIPRVEKFSTVNEYKLSMYEMLRQILYKIKCRKNIFKNNAQK